MRRRSEGRATALRAEHERDIQTRGVLQFERPPPPLLAPPVLLEPFGLNRTNGHGRPSNLSARSEAIPQLPSHHPGYSPYPPQYMPYMPPSYPLMPQFSAIPYGYGALAFQGYGVANPPQRQHPGIHRPNSVQATQDPAFDTYRFPGITFVMPFGVGDQAQGRMSVRLLVPCASCVEHGDRCDAGGSFPCTICCRKSRICKPQTIQLVRPNVDTPMYPNMAGQAFVQSYADTVNPTDAQFPGARCEHDGHDQNPPPPYPGRGPGPGSASMHGTMTTSRNQRPRTPNVVVADNESGTQISSMTEPESLTRWKRKCTAICSNSPRSYRCAQQCQTAKHEHHRR